MNVPTWIKPAVLGAAAGAIIATVLGFTSGTWVTVGKAEVMAIAQAKADVSEALLPICVELARVDVERAEKIEQIRGKPSYQRNNEITSVGWTTMPGTEKGDDRVASACVDSLLN